MPKVSYSIHFNIPRHSICRLLILAVLALVVNISDAVPASPKDNITVSKRPIATRVAGVIEQVSLPNLGIHLDAKLDTGAKSSALNAQNIEFFSKGRAKFVRFSLTDGSGKQLAVERPLVRMVRIRRAGVKVVKRPIIKLNVCVGGQTAVTLFSLTDRSRLNYQVLIGRRFLAGRFIVASGKTHLLRGKCRMP